MADEISPPDVVRGGAGGAVRVAAGAGWRKPSAGGGGYIFSPAHYILADVPVQNIFAMLEAVKDYGVYGKYPLN